MRRRLNWNVQKQQQICTALGIEFLFRILLLGCINENPVQDV